MAASGLSPRTVRWTHTILKMSLDYASDDGRLIAKNPATRTKFPPMRRTTHTYLTAREVAELADACGTQGDVVLILAYSGLRFGELTGLNVEDVDVEARRIRVRRSITQVGGRLVEGNPKSDAGRRSVSNPGTSGSCAESTTREPPTGRSGHHLPPRVAAGLRELKAVGQLESGDHQNRSEQDAGSRWPLNSTNSGGQGRDRTGDLPLFRRTLIPTELPGRKAPSASPWWRP